MSALARRLRAAGLDWIVPVWRRPVRVGALMTTRNGGVCVGDRASLDLGPARLDALDAPLREAIAENRRRVAAFLPGPPVWLEQVHGADVATVDGPVSAVAPVADAVVTRRPEVALAVRIADCLPVLLTDTDGTVVAAAHAGWRGLAAGVLEATLAAMDVDPTRVAAWIGPGIGPRAFEVGPDVLAAFTDDDADAAVHFTPQREGKWLADLGALARRRLARRGVTAIDADDRCTFADAARFFSWRRDRSAARMAAFVWLARDDQH